MPAKKRGLGNGLDSLIPPDEEKKEVIKSVNEIDINKVEPNKKQPRKNFNEDALNELSESIKQRGVIEPIIVKKTKNNFYTIVAGERRWRAAKLAGLKKVPVVIRDYTSQEVMEIALIENIQREDLNPIEESEAYDSLIKEYNLTQDQVAEKVSKSRTAVTNSLRLLKLDTRVREMLIEDKIKNGHARALLAIKDPELQYNTAVEIFDENMSVRETEKYVKRVIEKSDNNVKPKKKTPLESSNDIVYRNFENKLKESIGTKVSIKNKKDNKGKIEIDYYNKEDFERIMEILMKNKN